jgi:hypothetical protein
VSRELAVQHGLELQRDGGHAGAFGDLQRQLARGDPVDARAGAEDDPAAGKTLADGRRVHSRGVSEQRPRNRGPCRHGAEAARDGRAREQRRGVADGVAPRVVVARRDEHMIGRGGHARRRLLRDRRRSCAGLAGGGDGELGRAGLALVRDGNAHPVDRLE